MSLIIAGQKVRINATGYICLTDLSKARGGTDHIKNWLRNAETIAFLEAWEEKHGSNWVEFDPIKDGIGLNTYKVSVQQLIDAGVTSIVAQRGR